MHSTSLKDLSQKIIDLKIPPSSTVMIHSSLLKFGIIENGLKGFLKSTLLPKRARFQKVIFFLNTRPGISNIQYSEPDPPPLESSENVVKPMGNTTMSIIS